MVTIQFKCLYVATDFDVVSTERKILAVLLIKKTEELLPITFFIYINGDLRHGTKHGKWIIIALQTYLYVITKQVLCYRPDPGALLSARQYWLSILSHRFPMTYPFSNHEGDEYRGDEFGFPTTSAIWALIKRHYYLRSYMTFFYDIQCYSVFAFIAITVH